MFDNQDLEATRYHLREFLRNTDPSVRTIMGRLVEHIADLHAEVESLKEKMESHSHGRGYLGFEEVK